MKFPKGIHRTRRPKMSSCMAQNTGGHFWEVCTVILPDNSKVEGHYDKTRGNYFYFEIDGQWYKGPFDYDTGSSRWVITPDLRIAPSLV